MKIREGFISNSSTTSFTCDACGEIHAFHDSCSLEDMGIVEYSCGHNICCDNPDMEDEEVRKKWEDGVRQVLREKLKKLDNQEESEWLSNEYIQKEILKIQKVLDIKDPDEFKDNLFGSWKSYLPSSICPVCTLKSMNNDYIFDYVITKFKLNLDEIHNEIKSRFKNFTEYKEWINSQENKDENS